MGVFKRGKIWWVRYTDSDGVERRESAASSVKADAMKMLDELRVREARVSKGLEVRDRNPDRLTVTTLLEGWFAGPVQRQSRPKELAQTTRKHLCRAPLGDMLIDRVRAGHIADHLDECEVSKGKRVSATTRNGLRTRLATAYNWAIANGKFHGANPAQQVKRARQPEHVREPPTEDEVERIVAAAEAPDSWMIATSAYAGLRKGELYGAHIVDIDIEGRRIRIARSHGKGTKGGRVRWVPIRARLVPYLAAAIEAAEEKGSTFLFPGRTGERRHHASHTDRFFRKACEAAGINRPIRFHDLRHAFISNGLASGVPLTVMQKWAGHEDLSTTQRYAHATEALQESAIAKLEAKDCADAVRDRGHKHLSTITSATEAASKLA